MKYKSGFIIKIIFEILPNWENDNRFIFEHAEENTWTIRTISEISTKEAFLFFIEKYNYYINIGNACALFLCMIVGFKVSVQKILSFFCV